MISRTFGYVILILAVLGASASARPGQEDATEVNNKLQADKTMHQAKPPVVVPDTKEHEGVDPQESSSSSESKSKRKEKAPYKYNDPIDAAKILFSDDTTDVEVRAHAAWELARRSLEELRKIEDKLKKSSGRKRSSSSSSSSTSSESESGQVHDTAEQQVTEAPHHSA